MSDKQMRPQDPQGNPSADEAITAVSQVAYGFMGSQALFAALDLGLFTALETGPTEAQALANKIGAQLDPLRSLLEACLALGLVIREGETFRNSKAASRYLVKSARGYMGDYYLKQIAETLYHQMPDARAALRGEGAATYSHFLDDPVRTEAFIRGQHAGSSGPAYLLSRNPDLANYKSLLDLGGGSGAFSIEAVRRNPNLSAIVFDQPQVIAFAKKFIAEEGFEDRIRCVSGDVVKDEWPRGADLILLSYIVSSYRPQALQHMLNRAHAYLPKGGGIFIHDFAMYGDRPGPRNAALWQFANLAISASTYPHRQDEIVAAMTKAGFAEVDMRPHIPDITFLFCGKRL
jgi:predicted nicotinamide N-methyase